MERDVLPSESACFGDAPCSRSVRSAGMFPHATAAVTSVHPAATARASETTPGTLHRLRAHSCAGGQLDAGNAGSLDQGGA
jgi:hypothetical protein